MATSAAFICAESESAEDESTTGGQGDTIQINYNDFFSLPEKPETPSKCIGKCKHC